MSQKFLWIIIAEPCKYQKIDKHLKLHLKREPNFYFVNNYFDVGLKAWQANMDIQLDFNEYKAVTYVSIFLKN